MKHLRLILAFAGGFVVAACLGMFLSRLSKQARDIDTWSDVNHPLSTAIESIEDSAKQGDCETAAAQLGVLKQRFGEYQSGGPTPANWYHEVTAATRPARVNGPGPEQGTPRRAFDGVWMSIEEPLNGQWRGRSAYPLDGRSHHEQSVAMVNNCGCTVQFIGPSAYGDVYVVGGRLRGEQVPAKAIFFRGEKLLIFESDQNRVYLLPTSGN